MKTATLTHYATIALAVCLLWLATDMNAEQDALLHDGHDHGPARVEVTKEQVARLGIKVTPAAKGSVLQKIRVPGEILVNSDMMAHVVPQAPGVVRQVSAVLGQKVAKGDALAMIGSRTLAEAKALYLASVERLKLAQETFDREKILREEKVSSAQDLITARQTLAEARILERSAGQKLLTFGLEKAELPQLATNPESDFASYRLVAPFDGTIIQKHIVQGEVIDDQSTVFVVADLSSVWVDLAVSQDSVAAAKKGHGILLRLPGGGTAQTKIAFISPVVARETRTTLVRAVLDNPDEALRPGTFVDADILVPSGKQSVVVPTASVQLVDDHPCVFVWSDGAFELREVSTGASDGRRIEVREGLKEGDPVASVNAFHLKAEVTKSGGPSCSHGHAH